MKNIPEDYRKQSGLMDVKANSDRFKNLKHRATLTFIKFVAKVVLWQTILAMNVIKHCTQYFKRFQNFFEIDQNIEICGDLTNADTVR